MTTSSKRSVAAKQKRHGKKRESLTVALSLAPDDVFWGPVKPSPTDMDRPADGDALFLWYLRRLLSTDGIVPLAKSIENGSLVNISSFCVLVNRERRMRLNALNKAAK